MCDSCGCVLTSEPVSIDGHHGAAPGQRELSILHGILADNNHAAQHNREHFNLHNVLAINLMSAPGSGKTALLEATIDAFAGQYNITVVVGDLATENDANRLRRHGVQAVQINTGNTCHLDAAVVHHALHDIALEPIDILFIENVGNLVCPAAYDLGQHFNVVLLSVVEGDDKPAKYPVMFRSADLVLLTKSDLLPHLPGFDPSAAEENVRRLANAAPTVLLSVVTGEGMTHWCAQLTTWLAARGKKGTP